jgi:hypothetical protein
MELSTRVRGRRGQQGEGSSKPEFMDQLRQEYERSRTRLDEKAELRLQLKRRRWVPHR